MNSVETKTTDKTYAVKNTHKQEWETPQGLFDDLNKEYGFTLDAAASDKIINARNITRSVSMASCRTGKVKQYFAIPRQGISPLSCGCARRTRSQGKEYHGRHAFTRFYGL